MPWSCCLKGQCADLYMLPETLIFQGFGWYVLKLKIHTLLLPNKVGKHTNSFYILTVSTCGCQYPGMYRLTSEKGPYFASSDGETTCKCVSYVKGMVHHLLVCSQCIKLYESFQCWLRVEGCLLYWSPKLEVNNLSGRHTCHWLQSNTASRLFVLNCGFVVLIFLTVKLLWLQFYIKAALFINALLHSYLERSLSEFTGAHL